MNTEPTTRLPASPPLSSSDLLAAEKSRLLGEFAEAADHFTRMVHTAAELMDATEECGHSEKAIGADMRAMIFTADSIEYAIIQLRKAFSSIKALQKESAAANSMISLRCVRGRVHD